MPRLVSIRHTVDRFTIGRRRALVLEMIGGKLWANRRCGLSYLMGLIGSTHVHISQMETADAFRLAEKQGKKLEGFLANEIESHTCPICLELMVAPLHSPNILFPCGRLPCISALSVYFRFLGCFTVIVTH